MFIKLKNIYILVYIYVCVCVCVCVRYTMVLFMFEYYIMKRLLLAMISTKYFIMEIMSLKYKYVSLQNKLTPTENFQIKKHFLIKNDFTSLNFQSWWVM